MHLRVALNREFVVKRQWEYEKRDTASRLVNIVLRNGLIDTFMQEHFTGLRQTLVGGVPTLRNNLSGTDRGLKKDLFLNTWQHTRFT